MILAAKPQFLLFHQNLQSPSHRFLPKHDGKFQLLRIDELFQLECCDQFALLFFDVNVHLLTSTLNSSR